MNNILSTNHTSIYKLLFVLFLQGFVICHLNAMLRNTPNWTKYHSGSKKKLIMRNINYGKSWVLFFKLTTLFSKRYLSRKKKEILHLLQNTVSRIQNGSYNIEKGSLFCVADEFKIDSLTNWNTEILECRKKAVLFIPAGTAMTRIIN